MDYIQRLQFAMVFVFLIFIFLFSRTYFSISYCEACSRGCLIIDRYVIKSIMRVAELKQNFRFSPELGDLERWKICKRIRRINTIL